ncbi:MAG: nuclease domain-containing protein, partial [Verrucomicrobiota bacterium]
TFWPEDMDEAEAERRELLVHIHFDAKYRVENIEELFGANESEDADEEDKTSPGNYKRQDLLKMHAYRDAIKRSQGAYVLYPGEGNGHDDSKSGAGRWPHAMRGFHEILPGLGAFAIAPDENGEAIGLGDLTKFLDEVLAHLANRTTAQDRVSYHIAEAYEMKEEPVPYGALQLPETDIYGANFRALPPAEEMVLAAWYRNEAQKALAEREDGFAFVRLGRRQGALHVHPNLARVRHVLLRSEGGVVATGLLSLREPGLRVYTRLQLRAELQQRAGASGVAAWVSDAGENDEEQIYALFRTGTDPLYVAQRWNENKVMELIEAFETDLRNRLVENVGRTSPYPRILPLRDLLKARL